MKTAMLDPKTLRQLRNVRGISQRELGRRVATRLGRAEAANSLQVALSRLENRDALTPLDRETVDALAAELAVGPNDLGEPLYWIWAGLETGRLAVVAMALGIPAFTTPEAAYDARDQLSHSTEGKIQPFASAKLMPIQSGELYGELLDENYKGSGEDERRFLVEVDPDLDRLTYLAGLHLILNEDYDTEAAIEDLTLTSIRDYPQQTVDRLRRHEIALRRVVEPPPETTAPQLARWRREEERLFELVERNLAARRADREQVLAGVKAEA